MKKVLIITLALLPVIVNAQKGKGKTKATSKQTTDTVKTGIAMKTASGLEYTITQKGAGKKPQAGDKVVVHYTGKLINDTVFDSSLKRGQPFSFKLGAGQVIRGWDEAFQLLQVGDKATIKLTPELGYGAQQVGMIPANSTLIFDVELLDVVEGLRPLDASKMDTVTTPSGLKYIVFKSNPDAQKAEPGSKVIVHYSGFFKDGKIFDSSVERGQPISIKVGMGQVIAGWDEGLMLLRKGEKAKFIIPYQLAYGEQGRPPVIPQKSDLIFDVELLDVQAPVVIKSYDTTGILAKQTASGLKYYQIKHNDSAVKAEKGKMVKVHYTGYLKDGKIFDSSVDRGEPIEFPLGQGYVIQGWEEGIALMHVGDKLRLEIPYQLAYGEQGSPPVIPPKSDLIFDVELMEVR